MSPKKCGESDQTLSLSGCGRGVVWARDYLDVGSFHKYLIPQLWSEAENMCNRTAYQCLNLSQEQCDVAALTSGITDLVVSVISISLLLGLLLGLRKEALNSPLKRLSIFLCTFYGLTIFMYASVELYNDLLPEVWCEIYVFVEGYTIFTIFMYLNLIVALLLIQSGAPVIPGNWKLKLKSKLHLSYTFWPEFIFHPLVHLLSLSVAAVEVLSDKNICKSCEDEKYFTSIIAVNYFLLAFTLIGLFVNIILLGYFYIKFCRAPAITKRSKWLLLRLSAVFVSLVSVVVCYTLLYFIQTYYVKIIVKVGEITSIVTLVAMLTLLAFVYLPNIQCCKSCCERAPDQTPLLPNSIAGNTNPPSVWNHDVPSYTVYNPPPEMSDYVTNSVQYDPMCAPED